MLAIGTLVTGGLIHSPSGLCFCHCTVSSFRAQTTAHLVLSPLETSQSSGHAGCLATALC